MSDIMEIIAKAIGEFDLHSRAEYRYSQGADAILAALSGAGYAIVPRVPTEEMIETADSMGFYLYAMTYDGVPEGVSKFWAAMLAASPASPAPSYGIVHKREPFEGEPSG